MEKHFQWLDYSFWELCRGILEMFALPCCLWRVGGKTLYFTLWNHYVGGNYALCWNKILWRELGLLLWIRYSHHSWTLCPPLHSGRSLLPNLHQVQDKNLCLVLHLKSCIPFNALAFGCIKDVGVCLYAEFFAIICKYLATTYFVHNPCSVLRE